MPIRGSSLFQTCTVKLNPGTVASKHGDKKSFHQKKKHDSFRYLRIKTIVLIWSEWRDLNSRPLDPQSSALPTAPHPVTTLFIIQYSKGKCKPFFKKICFFLFSAKDRAKSAAEWFRRGPVFRAAADHQEKWESVFLQGGALCTMAAHGAAYGSSPRRKGERGKEGGRRSSGINYDFAGG